MELKVDESFFFKADIAGAWTEIHQEECKIEGFKTQTMSLHVAV